MKFANRIWMAQLAWAFGGGLPFFLDPAYVATWTTGNPTPEPVIIDQIRLIGAISMGFAAANALAITRQALSWQRGMAVIFIIFLVEWSFILWYNQSTGHYKDFVPLLTIVPALGFALLNMWIMFQPGRSNPVPNTRIDSKPVRLRWLWAVQGVFYFIIAMVCLFGAHFLIDWVSAAHVPSREQASGNAALTAYRDIAEQQIRIVSAWTLTLSLFSIYASLENRIRDWRQYRWPFVLAQVAILIGYGATAMGDAYQPWIAISMMFPTAVFAGLGFMWTLNNEPASFRSIDATAATGAAGLNDAPTPPSKPVGVVILWVVQWLILLITGLVGLFAPYFLVDAIVNNKEINPEHYHYAADALRVTSAFVLGLAGFTIFALMLSQTVARRRFAILFVICFGALALTLWLAFATDIYDSTVIMACAVLTLFTLFNLNWALQVPPGKRKQNNAGVAGSKPPSSWAAWFVQLLVLGASGIALILAADHVLLFLSNHGSATIVADNPDLDTAAKKLIHHQWQLVGIMAFVFAVLSGFGMVTQRESIWRGFAFIASATFLVVALTLVFVTFTDRYHLASLSMLVIAVVFFYMNRSIMRHPATWEIDDSEVTDAWTIIDLVAGPLMALAVLMKKRRSSHLLGSGARGRFIVAGSDDAPPEYPQHDLFVPGTEFPVQVRMANLTETDDAALDVRGFSLKLSNHRYHSPFDMMMNTGTFCPAFNLVTFAGFVASKFVPTAGSRAIVRSNLVAREGGIAGLRRAPNSFAELKYYSQLVRHWVDLEGVRHLVRYRVIPDIGIEESGLPSDEDAAQIWERGRLPQETRAKNYLRSEIKQRVNEQGVRMRFQAQFHTPVPGDTADWYNSSVEWDERICPWVDLGMIELNEALSDADTELLQFNPNNHPYTLGIPASRSPLDYRSMADSDARVVGALQRVRLWMYETFGPPSFETVEPPPEDRA